MPDAERLTIRSYRVVFQLERRLHKLDRWRIPVPYGVPLRGIAYALATLGAVVALQGLPLLGDVLRLLAPPLRLVILPVGVAYLLCRLRIDGRPAHATLLALVRHRLEPRRLSGFRAAPPTGSALTLGELALVPDERSARYRPALVEGPARLLLRYPARARAQGKTLEIRQASGEPMLSGKQLKLRAGQRLRVR